MSFAGKKIVVIGASGTVGSGVVRAYLDAGAQVVGVSRRTDGIARLVETSRITADQPFRGVVASFADETSAAAAKEAIASALNGTSPDHVVSAQGFASISKAATEAPLSELEQALRDGLYNNYLAAKALLPGQKAIPGASFTLVSGGLAHFPPPSPTLWLGTVKNAAVNALTYALAAETAKDAVRVNTVCLHFSVSAVGGTTNKFGTPAEHDTTRLGPAFLGVASGTRRGQVICLGSWAEADKLALEG